MSYSQDIFNHTKATFERLAEIDKQIADAKSDSSMYSYQYNQERLGKLQEQRETLIYESNKTADALLEEHKKKVHAEFMAKPEEITDDAKLLQSGIQFTNTELEEMLDRYSGNRTMERVIWDHAKGKGIKLNRKSATEADKILSAEQLRSYCRSAIQRPQYADVWLSDSYFAEISQGVD